jgi:hypothetical protein
MNNVLLSPEQLSQFEQQYGMYGRGIVKDSAEIDGHPGCKYAIVEEGEKLSITPSVSGTPALIEFIPRFLEWGDADSFLDMINALDYQVCQLRLRRALNEIEKLNSAIGATMRAALEDLPGWAVVRFAIAPSTRRRLARWHQDPAKHVASLCHTLKAEQRLSGKAVSGEGCWTALGDFFVTGKAGGFVDPRVGNWNTDVNLRAPRLVQLIPVDALSPNLRDISCPFSFEPYKAEEFAAMATKLEAVMEFAESVFRASAQAIRRCAKVVVAVKAITEGVGSSSHYTLPGQIFLRTSGVSTEAQIANALVHETIHQVLYVLESGRRFAEDNVLPIRPKVVSPWTGRQLSLDSYFHACFVWYGLATFWRRALRSTLLPSDSMEAQLNAALCGFRSGNPADTLLPYREAICPEAVDAVASLWEELHKSEGLNARSTVVRDSLRAGTTSVATATVVHETPSKSVPMAS